MPDFTRYGQALLEEMRMGYNGPPPDRIPASMTQPVSETPHCEYCDQPKPARMARCENCGHRPDPRLERKPAPPPPNGRMEADSPFDGGAFLILVGIVGAVVIWFMFFLPGIRQDMRDQVEAFRESQHQVREKFDKSYREQRAELRLRAMRASD